MPDPCPHAPSKWVGIVTNQNPKLPLDKGRPHASIAICARDECNRAAGRWVVDTTHEPAMYFPFEDPA